jgi:fatty acid/phospholipid biosynthesis enzyme
MKMTNAAEAMGGGPIWAVNGLVIKAHGRAKADEFGRGIGVAKSFIEKDVINALKSELRLIRTRLNTSEVPK